MGPHARQAREHVVVAGQFDLRLGVGRLGALGEDFEDEAGPVDDRGGLDDLLDVALLHARQFIVKDHIINVVLLAVIGDFLEFSAADIGGLVGTVHALDELLVAHGAGRLGEELQLVEVFVDLTLVVILLDDADKDCFLFSLILHILSKKGRPWTASYSVLLAYRSWKITGNW